MSRKNTRAAVAAQMAAALAGVNLESLEGDATATDIPSDDPTNTNAAGAEANANTPAEAIETSTEVTASDENKPAPAPTPEATVSLSTYTDLVRDNAKLSLEMDALKANVESLTAQMAAMTEVNNKATEVLKGCIENLSVALNTDVDTDGMSLQAVCEKYTSLQSKFVSRFPVGGKSRPLNSGEIAEPTADPALTQRLKGARNITKRA